MINLKFGQKHSLHSGFTLIETLLYLGLFGIIIGGGMVAVYQIIASSFQTNKEAIVFEESSFILQKIDWVLARSPEIIIEQQKLSLISESDIFEISLAENGKLLFKENNNEAIPLNNAWISVKDINFERTEDNVFKTNVFVESLGKNYHFESIKFIR